MNEIIERADLDKLSNIEKQIRFAAAVSLTRFVKEAQAKIIETIQDKFTVRGDWYKPSNKYGVRVETATPTKLEAAVKTAADWLIAHESGEDKKPRTGENIAVPTRFTRQSIRDKITKQKRPRSLKNSFVLNRNGELWLYRRTSAKRYPILPMYRLVKSARIKKESTVIEPTLKLFKGRYGVIFRDELRKAFKSAK